MMMVKKNYTLLSLLLFRTKKLKLSLSNSLQLSPEPIDLINILTKKPTTREKTSPFPSVTL